MSVAPAQGHLSACVISFVAMAAPGGARARIEPCLEPIAGANLALEVLMWLRSMRARLLSDPKETNRCPSGKTRAMYTAVPGE